MRSAWEKFVKPIQMNLLDISQSMHGAGSGLLTRTGVSGPSPSDLQILMLDALADPLRRGEALQQFARLYRTPERPGTKRDVRAGCTSC
jgi:hypothetical protein